MFVVKYLLLISVCATVIVGGNGRLMSQINTERKDSKSSAETRIDLWDPVPESPSTKPPREILDGYWRSQFKRVNREVAAAKDSKVVFFGDSITLNWSNASAAGQAVWKEKFSRYRPINMGNSGDITPVMLYRVNNGNLDFPKDQHPRVAVLLCGTNNFVVTKSAGGKVEWDLGANCPPEDVAHGVRAIAQVFRRKLPNTYLIVMGVLPVANKDRRENCRKVNDHLKKIRVDKDHMVFVDLWDRFTNADGSLRKKLFSDGTHLTSEGYQVWAEGIESIIADRVAIDKR